jgi:peroxiredoxin
MRVFLLLAIAAALLPSLVWAAGDDEKTLKIGDPAPAWTDLPGIDGKLHALSDLKDNDVVVVAFTCNSCPVAVAYEDRIIAFHKKYCSKDTKVALVTINVNVIPEDLLPRMQERAKLKSFEFLYLFDKSQKIAKDFDAHYTPEFFVFGKDRKLVYKGAMDDTSSEKKVTKNYLDAAVDAALKGTRPEIEQVRARGCAIRYDRRRP